VVYRAILSQYARVGKRWIVPGTIIPTEKSAESGIRHLLFIPGKVTVVLPEQKKED
jgi:hypothetical protein